MAKNKALKVVGVKPGTVALFEGTLAAIVGFAVALLFSMQSAVNLAESTQSVLRGFAFGLGAGVVSVIVLPLIYFGLGWVFGYLHGWILNAVLGSSGGLQFDVEE